MIFGLWVFNKYGDCILQLPFNRWPGAAHDDGENGLVAGLVYTLQLFSSQLSSTGVGGFKCMRTPLYKLHYFETMTKYRLVLASDVAFDGALAQSTLQDLFQRVFVEWVVKDPTYKHEEGSVVTGSAVPQKVKDFFVERRLL